MNSEPDIPNLENLKAEPERSSLRRKDENLNGATFKKPFSRVSDRLRPTVHLNVNLKVFCILCLRELIQSWF